MSTPEKSPLKGHWPVAFALGGTVKSPALVPLNYTLNVLAGDEYRVPVTLPADPVTAGVIEARMDSRGWARMGPAVGHTAVVAMLSIPEFADRPVIVSDQRGGGLADLGPGARTVITLADIRDAARKTAPDRDPAARAPETTGSPLAVARNLGFCTYWALSHGLTPTRRRQAMQLAGWPDAVVE